MESQIQEILGRNAAGRMSRLGVLKQMVLLKPKRL